MIQWSRACEETLKPDVEKLERAFVDRDAQGRLADPIAYLRDRAAKILSLFDAPFDRWTTRIQRVKYVAAFFVIALGALVFPFARVDTILGSEVNLAGPFLFFLATQAFFLTFSLILACPVVLMSCVRHVLGRERPISWSEKAVQALSSIVGSLVIWTMRRVVPACYSFFGRKSSERFAWRGHSVGSRRAGSQVAEPSSDDIRLKEEKRRAHGLFWDTLFSRPRVLTFWGGALSHTFWASCSLCVLLILVARMQGNRYDYCWHTSLEDERAVKQGVDILGAPISLLGLDVPNDDDVAALFTDFSIDPNAKVDQVATMSAGTRAKWSYFLLATVFVWCFIPRLMLVGIYYLLYRRALRDFRPDLAEAYFRDIVDRAEGYCTTTQAVLAPEHADDRVEEHEPIAAPAAPIWNRVERTDKPVPLGAPETPPRAIEGSPAPVSAPPVPVADPSPSIETEAHVVAPAKDSAPPEFAPEPAAGATSPAPEVAPPESATVAPTLDEPRVESSPESEVVSRAEREERRLTAALTSVCGLSDNVFAYSSASQGLALAMSYDVTIESDLIRELFGSRRELALFDDVASPDSRKALREFLETKGDAVELCAVFTDFGLPPARHFVRFMRDVLTPSLDAAKIVIVLSGGERMRLKFATSPKGAAERVQDWTSTIETMAKASGKSIEAIQYYDAELNLPEPRVRLSRFLSGADEIEKLRRTPRDLKKWDGATAIVLKECREIFDAKDLIANDETLQLRIAKVVGEIFNLYSKEVGKAAHSGRGEFSAKLGAQFASRLSNSKIGENLTNRAKELGLTQDFFESRLTAAMGMAGSLRKFASKLNPKCALVAASVGMSVPVAVAFAPLLGGAVSATTLLSTIGALGATGAVAGALAPSALRRCLSKASGKRADESSATTDAPESVEIGDRASIAATIARAAATWAATLELQGLSEDAIIETLPNVLTPFEESSLNSESEIASAFALSRKALENVPLI